MIFAYADPPYPGNAKRYPEKTEVDHRELINRLVRSFPDGWALSSSSVALQDVLAMCPPHVRIAAWVKPFAVFKPNVNPAYAWEPVIFQTKAKRSRSDPTVRDWVSANITLRKGIVGAKPPQFAEWLLDLLGFTTEDTIIDLYPGTGIIGLTAAARRAQYQLVESQRQSDAEVEAERGEGTS